MTYRICKRGVWQSLLLVLFACTLAGEGFASQHAAKGADADGNVAAKAVGRTHQKEQPEKFKQGEILVKFKKGVSDPEKRRLHEKHGAAVLKEFKRIGVQQIRLKKGQSVEEALAEYRSEPAVEYAEPDFAVSAQAIPDDPQFPTQWALRNTLYTGAPDVGAADAWNITTGSSNVTVAVIDTGVDYNHQDLSANIWLNQAELNGAAGVDDDGAGYVDDLHGIDVYNNDANPMDDNDHGTHVAGIIGAAGNNGIGVSGMNWNVQILPCKFMGAGGSGYLSGAIACLQYVRDMKDQGHNIAATNNSWGYSGDPSQSLRDAIAAQGDILFIAAAGNDGADNDKAGFFPAGYDLPNVISVASFDQPGALSSFSNFGSHTVHTAAPGGYILSTTRNNTYQKFSGTSMAAPHVTGLAALLQAQDPAREWKAIKNLILAGGHRSSSMVRTVTGSRIDAVGSLTCSNRPTLGILQFPATPVVGAPSTISALSINCAAAAGPVTVSLGGGGTVQLLDDGVFPDLIAGDGVFTGSWTPTSSAVETLSFSSPAGSSTVASPPLRIGQTVVAPPAINIAATVTAATVGLPYQQTFPVSGGVPPLSWQLNGGNGVPQGLTLNSATGEISGIPSAGVVSTMNLVVTDSVGMKDQITWTIIVNSDLRPGWPQVMQQHAQDLSKMYGPILADLDGDGKDEIIAVDQTTLYVFNAAGLVKKTVLPSKVSTPVVTELNGDGKMAIVVATDRNYSSPNPIYAFDSDLNLLPGFPAGEFPTYYNSAGEITPPTVADLDGDGKKEIIQLCSPNNIYDQNFEKGVLLVVDSRGAMLPGWPKVVGLHSDTTDYQPAVGDMDADGNLEIVYASRDGYLHIFRKDGTEVRNWQFDPGTFGKVYAPVLADLDGNGTLSIVFKYENSSSSNVAVFDANGVQRAGWPRTFGSYDYGLIAADLDGNGAAEIILVTRDSYGMPRLVQALRGDGSSLPNYPVNIGGYSYATFDNLPAVADLNGDGSMDLLVVADNALYAFDATGAALPGFPKYMRTDFSNRTSAAIGDLDGNGRLDIVMRSEDGTLWAWEMPQATPVASEWPLYRHDAQHTGALQVLRIDPVTTPTNLTTQTVSGVRKRGTTVRVTFDTGAVAGEMQYPTDSTWQCIVSALAEGKNVLTATDSLQQRAIKNIIVDTIAPTVSITSPTAGIIADAAPLLGYSVSDGTVVVKVDGMVTAKVSGSRLDTLPEGAHTVRVEATDGAMNTGAAELSFTVDLPPAVTMSSPVADFVNSSTPLLSYTVSKGTVTVKVDGTVVNAPSGSTLGPLAEGPHTVRVEAVDAGRTGYAERRFTVDTVPPAVSISSPVAGTTADNQPLLTYTVSDGTVTVKVDGLVVAKSSGSLLDALANGTHTVRVESRDQAGNLGVTEVTFTVNAADVFYDGMESGLAKWESATGLWHIVTTPATYANSYSGSSAWWYGNDATGTYNTGGVNSGALVSLPFTVPAYAQLTFWSWEQTESAAGSYDTRKVYISTDGGSSWTALHGSLDNSAAWHQVAVDLSAYAGTSARLKFEFNTVDAISNDYRGWYLDEVKVAATTPPPVSAANEGFESGNFSSLPWVMSGNAPWVVTTISKHSGQYAAKAGTIIDNQSSAMEAQVQCAAGNMSFWYSVSSEANYDFLTFYLDGVQKGKWSGTVSWTQLSVPVTAGVHTFKWVYSKDVSLSVGSDTAWIDDIVYPAVLQAPTVTISSPAAGPTGKKTPLLSYQVSGGSVVVKVDGVVVQKVSGQTLDPLVDGPHTVRVEATNAVGTVFQEVSFTVDTVPPAVGIDPIASPTNNSSQTVSGTRESNATINVSANPVATIGAVTYPSATTWSCTVSALAEGDNVFTAMASDAAFNSATSSVTITLDTVAPVVSITSPTEVEGSATPLLAYTVSEGAAVVTLDGVVVTKASGDTLGPLVDGPHTVRVEATDAASNKGSAEVSFTVDTVAPTVTITSPSTGLGNNRTPLLSFTVSEGTPVVKVDGAVLPLLSGDPLPALADGPHTVRVESSDDAGHSAFAEVSFTVDATAPAVTITSPASGLTNNKTPALFFTASDGAVVVKVDGNVVAKASGDTLAPLADGLHVVRVEATDAANNTGFAEITFSVDAAPPVVSITSPAAGTTADNTPLLGFTASDGVVAVMVDGIAVNKVSGASLDALSNGSHTVRVEATDTAGNVGADTVTFTVSHVELAISTATLPWNTTGVGYSQTLTAVGGIPGYSWSIISGALPDGVFLDPSTGVVSGTPTAAGSFTFTVQVADSDGAAVGRPLTIAVYEPLAITPATLPAGYVGAVYSQPCAATGGLGPYNWSVVSGSLPPGLTLNGASGVISGTPTTVTTVSFTLQVTDAHGTTASKAMTITVNAARPDLVVTSVSGPASGTHGRKISVSVTVKNQGEASAAGSAVTLYLSTDSGITTGDLRLADVNIGSLAAGASQTVNPSVTIPSITAPGTYFIGAICDTKSTVLETNETNNSKAGNTIKVQ